MAKQIFKTDKKFWTQTQSDQIEVFFQFNSFFSKFYEHKDFDKIVGMTYYSRLNKLTPLLLENSKRPVVIILLSGQVEIHKKVYKDNSVKRIRHKTVKIQMKQPDPIELFEVYTHLIHENDSFVIESQCKIVPLNEKQAEILFVPSILYNQHIKHLDHQKIQLLFRGLKGFFPGVEKKVLMNLAKSGCYYKEFRMHDFIYRAGNTPSDVYLVLEGNVKLEKPGFSAKKMSEMLILNPSSIFGERDIKLQHRQQSAISCSAYARTLVIPKKYSNFLTNAQIIYQICQRSLTIRSLSNLGRSKLRPSITKKQRKLPLLIRIKETKIQAISLEQQDLKLKIH